MRKIILNILLASTVIFTYACKEIHVEEKVNKTTMFASSTELEEITETSETTTYNFKDHTTRHPSIKTTEETSESCSEPTIYYSDDEASALILAKTIYGEARGVYSVTEQACIAWTILNRVDYYGGSVYEVATSPNQFAYSYSFPTIDDYGRDLIALSRDVLGRWEAEKQGVENVGRVLPSDYMWYAGDGYHNYFRNSYEGGPDWDYSLNSPYES